VTKAPVKRWKNQCFVSWSGLWNCATEKSFKIKVFLKMFLAELQNIYRKIYEFEKIKNLWRNPQAAPNGIRFKSCCKIFSIISRKNHENSSRKTIISAARTFHKRDFKLKPTALKIWGTMQDAIQLFWTLITKKLFYAEKYSRLLFHRFSRGMARPFSSPLPLRRI